MEFTLMTERAVLTIDERFVHIPAGSATLEGNLNLPERARALVLFAHGSGSSRHSPRNRYVARVLNETNLATLLLDLLTPDEEAIDLNTAHLRFDIDLLAARLVAVTDWVTQYRDTQHLPVGYFGASTGAAAALVASAERPQIVGAIVSRGGRPDLAGSALARVRAPTLLIVGGKDIAVIQMNRAALAQLRCEKQIAIVPGATHLFEEPGTLDEVARLAREWFNRHLMPTGQSGDSMPRDSERGLVLTNDSKFCAWTSWAWI
jgi:dienelactone hydrolase